MPPKKQQKRRGPSRPIDPRYAPGPDQRRKGPDTFAYWLIGLSTAFVLIVIFLATQGIGNTATTTTSQPAANTGGSNTVDPAATGTAAEAAVLTRTAGVQKIDPSDALALYNAQNVKIIDVRDKTQYSAGHVKGATNIPYTDVQTRLAEFPKTGNLILYCQ